MLKLIVKNKTRLTQSNVEKRKFIFAILRTVFLQLRTPPEKLMQVSNPTCF